MICAQCEGAIPEGAGECPHCGALVVIAETMTADTTATDTTAMPAPAGAWPAAEESGPAAAGAGPVGAGAGPAAAVSTPGGSTPFKFEASRWSQADRIAGGASVVVFISLFLPWFSFHYIIGSVSISGLTTHGYLYIVLLVCLAIFAYLIARAGFAQMPFKLPMAHEPALLIATVVNLALVLIGLIDKPAFWGWSYGGFVALVAAVVAAAPIGLPAIQARNKPANK